MGFGQAILLNTAISLISDTIGKDTKSGAFVYGSIGFVDKVANGLLIFLGSVYVINSPAMLRVAIAFNPTLLAFVVVCMMYQLEKYHLKKS